jgi:uncharacterized protein YdeI (YjbR/CyaY-like superfamily)
VKPAFFPTPDDFRNWLKSNHESHKELLVGFYKKGSGKPSITWPESVREALCFGWIDGIRRNIDEESYSIRFTQRRTNSTWSAINIKLVEELTAAGLMQAAGLRAFERRKKDKSAIYAYEQRKTAVLGPTLERRFRAERQAWEFFRAQAPWYRRTSTYWVISAKKKETQLKRLGILIDSSAAGRRIDRLNPTSTRSTAKGQPAFRRKKKS